MPAGTHIGNLLIRLGADPARLEKGLRQAERSLRRSSRNLGRIGDNINRNVTLPFLALSTVSAKFAANVETSFAKISNLTNATEKEISKFRGSVEKLSTKLGRSQTELAESLFVIRSGGLKGAKALEALEASSKAASIGLGEISDISRVSAAIMTAYSGEIDKSSHVMDMLAATAKEGNFETSALAGSLGKVIPNAKSLNISLPEVLGNIASLTRVGNSASESVTALNSLLANIVKPSTDGAKALAEVGLSIQDVRDSIAERGLAATLNMLVDAFGGNIDQIARVVPNMEGLKNILGNSKLQADEYAASVNKISTSMGSVDKAFDRVSQTADQKMKVAIIGLKNAATEMGNILLPIVKDLADKVSRAAKVFSGLDESTKRNILRFGALISSIGIFTKLSSIVLGQVAGMASAFKNLSIWIFKTRKNQQSYQKVLASGLKSGVFALVAVAIAGAVAVFRDFNKQLKMAKERLDFFKNAQAQARAENAVQIDSLNTLKDVISDNTASLEERSRAIEQLKRINPEYFGNLSTEANAYQAATEQIDKYIDNLIRSSEVKILKERFEDNIRSIQELKDGISDLDDPSTLQSLANGFKSLGNIVSGFGGNPLESFQSFQTESSRENAAQLVKELEKMNQGILKSLETEGILKQDLVFEPQFDFQPTIPSGSADEVAEKIDKAVLGPAFVSFQNDLDERTSGISFDVSQVKINGIKAITDPLAAFKGQIKNSMDSIKLLGTVFGDNYDVMGKQLDLVNGKITDFADRFGAMSSTMPGFQYLLAMRDALMKNREELDKNKESLQRMKETALEFSNAISQAIETGLENMAVGIGEAIGVAKNFSDVFKGIGKSILNQLLNVLEQVGKLAIATGIAVEGIMKAFKFNPFAAIVGGIALIALVKAVKSKLSNAAPKLAEGGLATGPTLSLVGDNPGASQFNPEVIAPLSKLKNMIGDASGGPQILKTKISGDDLWILLDRARVNRARKFGV